MLQHSKTTYPAKRLLSGWHPAATTATAAAAAHADANAHDVHTYVYISLYISLSLSLYLSILSLSPYIYIYIYNATTQNNSKPNNNNKTNNLQNIKRRACSSARHPRRAAEVAACDILRIPISTLQHVAAYGGVVLYLSTLNKTSAVILFISICYFSAYVLASNEGACNVMWIPISTFQLCIALYCGFLFQRSFSFFECSNFNVQSPISTLYCGFLFQRSASYFNVVLRIPISAFFLFECSNTETTTRSNSFYVNAEIKQT